MERAAVLLLHMQQVSHVLHLGRYAMTHPAKQKTNGPRRNSTGSFRPPGIHSAVLDPEFA